MLYTLGMSRTQTWSVDVANAAIAAYLNGDLHGVQKAYSKPATQDNAAAILAAFDAKKGK